MTKPVKRKAKGTAVKAWGCFRGDTFIGSGNTRESARCYAKMYYKPLRVRPIRITVLKGKG